MTRSAIHPKKPNFIFTPDGEVKETPGFNSQIPIGSYGWFDCAYWMHFARHSGWDAHWRLKESDDVPKEIRTKALLL